MIPLRDNIPSRHIPFVNYAVIAICGFVFYLQLQQTDPFAPSLVEEYGMIPVRVLHPDRPVTVEARGEDETGRYREVSREAVNPPFNPWLTLLTCTFLHGGWLHFLGNMWFLFIFGDNVEDRLGHVGYLGFYLLCGAAASAAHLYANTLSMVPTIGASGAIAGVMGAYLFLYPHAKVLSILPIFIIIQIIVIPAPVFLGIWFLLQLYQGTMSATVTEAQGVAWWAHIGGFVVGAAIALVMKAVGWAAPPVTAIRPHTDHSGMYRTRLGRGGF